MKRRFTKKQIGKAIIIVLWVIGLLSCILVSQFRASAAQLDQFHVTAALNFREAQVPSASAISAANALQVTYWGYPGDDITSGSAGSQTVTIGDLVSGDQRLGVVMLNGLANKTAVFTLLNATNFRIPFMIMNASTNQTYLTGYALEATAGVSSSYVITEEALGLSSSAGITFRIVVGVPFRYNETPAAINFVARLPDGTEQNTYQATFTGSMLSGAAAFAPYSYLSSVAPSIGVYSPDLSALESVYYSVNSYVQTVYIPYTQSGRKLTVEYYSGTDPTSRIGLMQYSIGTGSGYREQGTYAGMTVYPERVYYPEGEEDLTVRVYLVDTQLIYDQGFNAGKSEQNLDEVDLDIARQEGYEAGYEAGYLDGYTDDELKAGVVEDLKNDYNAITGFFDGIWNAISSFFSTIFDGVGLGGVTVGHVFYTVIGLILITLFGVWLINR